MVRIVNDLFSKHDTAIQTESWGGFVVYKLMYNSDIDETTPLVNVVSPLKCKVRWYDGFVSSITFLIGEIGEDDDKIIRL